MIVNVRMADGRTTFQFASRGDLRRVLGHEPDQEGVKPVLAWAKWNPQDLDWVEVQLQYLRKHSIAFTIRALDMATGEADLPAGAEAERRQQVWAEQTLTASAGPGGSAAA